MQLYLYISRCYEWIACPAVKRYYQEGQTRALDLEVLCVLEIYSTRKLESDKVSVNVCIDVSLSRMDPFQNTSMCRMFAPEYENVYVCTCSCMCVCVYVSVTLQLCDCICVRVVTGVISLFGGKYHCRARVA